MKECYDSDFFGKKNVALFLLLCLALFLLLPQAGHGETWEEDELEREFTHAPEDVPIKNIQMSLTGHDFRAGSSRRTYNFHGNAAYRTYKSDGSVDQTGRVQIEDQATWDGETKQLKIHQKIHCIGLGRFTTDTLYSLPEGIDPFLAHSPPDYKVIHYSYTGPGSKIPLQPGKRSDLQRLWDGISGGRRTSMTWEALAKSMHLEISSTKIKTPPGDALLTMKYATDVPVPQNWTAQFWLERKAPDGKWVKEFDTYKRLDRLPVRGAVFCMIEALLPGEYAAYTRMLTSLTSHRDSQKLFFHVSTDTPGSNSSNPRTAVVVQPEEGQIIPGAEYYFYILWDNKARPGSHLVLRIEYRKSGSKDSYRLLKEERIPGNGWKYEESIYYTKVVSLLKFDADYRVRVALDDQAYKKGNAHWCGGWRHFRGWLERELCTRKPSSSYNETYVNTIPVEIELPSNLTEKPVLRLSWQYQSAPDGHDPKFGAVGVFRDLIFEEKIPFQPGTEIFKKSVKVATLLKKMEERHIDATSEGKFFLDVSTIPVTKTCDGKTHHTTEFFVAQLGAPPRQDDRQKKSLTHHMTLPALTILPFKVRYRPMEDIAIQMKKTGKKPQFQVRFRAQTGKPYTLLRHVWHKFTTQDNETTLHLKFKQPGQYQVRFRSGRKDRWSSWQAFEVEGMNLAGMKNIKPPTAGRMAMRLFSPVIETPREREGFILTGKEIPIKAKIRHAAGDKVKIEVQRGERGHFRNARLKINTRKGKTETTFTLHVTKTGDYRIRTKITSAPHAAWSGWRTFKVDRINKKILRNLKPHIPAKGPLQLSPVIETPRERQGFILTGKEIPIKAKIRHAAGARVKIEVQRGERGHFRNARLKINTRKGKTETTFTLHVTKTGDYRIRTKITSAPHAAWSGWRTFKVDRINKKIFRNLKPHVPARAPLLHSPGMMVK